MISGVYLHATGLWARHGTRDDMILDEVLDRRCYRDIRLADGDVIADIGANIGATAHYLDRRARAEGKHVTVHSFEPDVNNLRMLRQNVFNLRTCRVWDRAVVTEPGPVTLYVSRGANLACHSVVKKIGYDTVTVSGIGLDTVLQDVRPTVIKCDIEGGEYVIDWTQLRDSTVRQVVMEVHLGRRSFREMHAPLLAEQLRAAGYHQRTRTALTGQTAGFNRIINWTREAS